MASAHLDQVFEPFFTTKPVGQGLGLGLAVSYGIVREMGGTLEVSNDEQGAVFTLTLPAAEEHAAE
ncbi:ATP-binding protein [Leclercia adecarboxylata]|nr:ATP-binding protein [Leclercia adecarboxylata]